MTYLRNRVRHRILPLLLQENPAFLERAGGLWKLGRLDADWFASLLPALAEAPDEIPCAVAGGEKDLFLPRERLACLPKALRLRCCKAALDSLGPGQARLESLLALDDSFEQAGGKSLHRFPGKKTALVNRQGIFWKKT